MRAHVVTMSGMLQLDSVEFVYDVEGAAAMLKDSCHYTHSPPAALS